MKDMYAPYVKAFVFFSLITIFSLSVSAQVGIGTTSPNGGAMLDVESANKGVLIPRVNIANLNTLAPVTGGQAEGMLVYNTNTTTGPGFFYWNSNTTTGNWVAVTPAAVDAWELGGNSGTTPGTGAGENYIGTSDPEDLVIATDGAERVRVLSTGEVGIGTTGNPTQRLHVNGNLRLEGAFMPGNDAGTGNRVLTSAGTGASPVWGADMGNVNGIHRYVTSPGMDINAATNNSITVTVPGLTTGATAIVNIQGNWSAAIYDDITIHNIEVRTGEVRFGITNNTGFWGGGTNYPGMIFNVTVIR